MRKSPPELSLPVEFPDRPRELGALLQTLREESDLRLDEIVQETKVSKRVFEALESGSYERLPQQVFCRNFLRQYAAMIQIPEKPLLEAFDRAWDNFRISSGSYAALMVEEPPQRVFRWWLWTPIILGILVVGILSIMMFRSCRVGKDLQRDPRRSSGAVIPSPTAGVVIVAEMTEIPALPTPETSSQERVRLTISVLPGRECWIRYRDHQGRMGQDLLRQGRNRELDLPAPVFLTLGNADAVRVEVGGRSYESLGLPGQVVHLEVSRDSLKKLGPAEVAGG